MFLDKFAGRDDQRVWLVAQDVDYPNPDHLMTEDRCKHLDRLLALCPTHQRYLKDRYPWMTDKINLSRNGLRVDLIERLERHAVDRNPYRIVWTGSPDRGMIRSLEIFKRAQGNRAPAGACLLLRAGQHQQVRGPVLAADRETDRGPGQAARRHLDRPARPAGTLRYRSVGRALGLLHQLPGDLVHQLHGGAGTRGGPDLLADLGAER